MYYDNRVFEKSSNILVKDREESGTVLTRKLERLLIQLSKLLTKVKKGDLAIEKSLQGFKELSYKDLGVAKIDTTVPYVAVFLK